MSCGTHVAWLRGTGQKPNGSFEKVELWASAYTTRSASPAPFLVGDYEVLSTNQRGRGEDGRVAYLVRFDPPMESGVRVRNLVTKEARTLPTPTGFQVSQVFGVAKGSVYFTAMKGLSNEPRRVFRWKVGI